MFISLISSVPAPQRASQESSIPARWTGAARQPATDRAIYAVMPTGRLRRALDILVAKCSTLAGRQPVDTLDAIDQLQTVMDCNYRRVMITAEMLDRGEDILTDPFEGDDFEDASEIEAQIKRAG